MTRHVSDELLSAYLDGELSSAERAEVERQLAASLADREMLAELQGLRRELTALPRYQADAGFAERVVAAATEARAVSDATAVQPAKSRASRSRHTVYLALAASAAAALLVLVTARWQSSFLSTAENNPSSQQGPRAVKAEHLPAGGGSSSPLMAALGSAPLGEAEAVVLRLRLPSDQPITQAIDAALAAAGIGQRPASDLASGAMELGAAYRRRADQNHAAESQSVAAVDALYVEAPLAQLEAALAALQRSCGGAPLVSAEDRLAFARPALTDRGEGEGEGEGAMEDGHADPGQPFAQRLNAGMFRLNRQVATAPAPGSAVSVPRPASLRVLILVEHATEAP